MTSKLLVRHGSVSPGLSALVLSRTFRVRRSFVDHRATWTLAGLVSLIVGGWLLLALTSDSVRFVLSDPGAKTGFEVFLAIGQLFAALVLVMAPVGVNAGRMRWVSAGLVLLGAGAFGLGYVYQVVADTPQLSSVMYGSLYVRTLAAVLIAIGLVSAAAPEVRLSRMGSYGLLLLIPLIPIVIAAQNLMPLFRINGHTSVIIRGSSGSAAPTGGPLYLTDLERALTGASSTFPGLTGWHWVLSLIPLVAACFAAWGAISHHAQGHLNGWFLVGVLLLAGTQIHALFWPSTYSPVITTTSVLRLVLAFCFVIGGIVEMRRVVYERAELLSREQQRVRQLQELSVLKADFSSMVAHELASPLAAISTMSEMISTGDLPAELARDVGQRIHTEAQFLQSLVNDVRASAEVERDDFRVSIRTIPLTALITDARQYASTLPGTHPLSIDPPDSVQVLADRERIGQVLRNLLANAVRHTPAGTPIALNCESGNGTITISVTDKGPGISARDQQLIFGKFERGATTDRQKVPGHGLGLYLSSRIVLAHGSELQVRSDLGEGTTFWFTLKETS